MRRSECSDGGDGQPARPVEHILFHIQGIAQTMRGVSYEDFHRIYHLERAVERTAQIISEAVRALPLELLERHPEIEWAKIMAIGNVYGTNINASTLKSCGTSRP